MTLIPRSSLAAGIAVVGISALAVPLSVAPPAPARAVESASTGTYTQHAVQLTQLSEAFEEWRERLWPSAFQAPPTPPPNTPVPTPTSLAGSLETAYHVVEPWVRYGFQLAEYAVGWVPYVGWLAPQVMIFYNFGERIVHAIAHNTLDWLDGDGSLLTNIAEGVSWTVDAFIQLGIDEWNFFLPPLPPLPPWPFAQDFEAGYEVVRTSVRDFLQNLSDSVLSGVDEQPEEQPAEAPVATEELSIEAEAEPEPDTTPPVELKAEQPEEPAEEQQKPDSGVADVMTTADTQIRDTLDGADDELDQELAEDQEEALEPSNSLESSPSATVETPGDDDEVAAESPKDDETGSTPDPGSSPEARQTADESS